MIRMPESTIIEALKVSRGNITRAAESIGLCRQHLSSRISADPELKAACETAREVIIDQAETNLFIAVEDGDIKASEFVLRTLGRNRGYAQKTEIEGSLSTKSEIVILEIPDNGRGVKTTDG